MQTTTPDDDVAMMQWCVEHAPPLPLELSITPVSERTSAFASLESVGELDGVQKTSATIAEELGRLHAELRRRREGAARRTVVALQRLALARVAVGAGSAR